MKVTSIYKQSDFQNSQFYYSILFYVKFNCNSDKEC